MNGVTKLQFRWEMLVFLQIALVIIEAAFPFDIESD